MDENTRQVRAFIRYLRKHHPITKCKVIVKIGELKGAHGDFHYRAKTNVAIIKIRSNKFLPIMFDAVIHEWAHLLDDTPWNFREEHRDSWGIWYSRMYRAWLKFVEA